MKSSSDPAPKATRRPGKRHLPPATDGSLGRESVWRRGWHFLTIALLMTALSCAFLSPRLALPYELDEVVDGLLLDQYFRLRGAASPHDVSENLSHTNEIVIVELPHQVPRRILADLVTKLRLARVVALDLMIIDREGELSKAEKPLYKKELRSWREDDRQLAAAVRDAGNVVLGTWPEERRDNNPARLGEYVARLEWRQPSPVIWKAARGHGHLIANEDHGVVRRIHALHDTGVSRNNSARSTSNASPAHMGSLHEAQSTLSASPSLGIAMVGVARGLSSVQLNRLAVRHGVLHLPGEGIPTQQIPLDADGSFRINFVGGRECFEYATNRIMYHLVVTDWNEEEFADKIVIVGENSWQSEEISNTPFGLMPSMQIHANVVATFLGSGPPLPLSPWLTAGLALGSSLLLVLPLLRWPLWASFLVAVGESAGMVILGGAIFASQHKVLAGSVPLLAIVLTYNAIALYEYRRARETLGRFIGPEMVSQAMHIFKPLNVGGREEIATALFCDMRNYSTLSELISPLQITRLIADYNENVTRCAARFGGRSIDFQGDGVFVLFETAHAGDDHAGQAVQAALQMQQAFVELRARWQPRLLDDGVAADLEFGIGVETGMMMIGVFGSHDRIHLGAIGDAVNVASRVQGLTQMFGHSVLITQNTFDRVASRVEVAPCGTHRVKGRSASIEVFGVLQWKPDVAPDAKRAGALDPVPSDSIESPPQLAPDDSLTLH